MSHVWWGGYGHMAGWGWWAWLGMGLMMLLFWGLLAAVVVMLVRSLREGGRRAPGDRTGDEHRDEPGDEPGDGVPTASAESTLEQRFARGEIEEEEFLRRRRVLRGG